MRYYYRICLGGGGQRKPTKDVVGFEVITAVVMNSTTFWV
jgi:hypothetical protein